jgi:hypothetical protein
MRRIGFTLQPEEREVSEKRVSRWPIIPLIGGPIGILIVICYVASVKPPAPVAPSASADVNEQTLLNEAEELKGRADQLYQKASAEEDQGKRNKLCDEARNLCEKAQAKFDRIREAYQERGLLDKGVHYQWEQSNEELNRLIDVINFIRGFDTASSSSEVDTGAPKEMPAANLQEKEHNYKELWDSASADQKEADRLRDTDQKAADEYYTKAIDKLDKALVVVKRLAELYSGAKYLADQQQIEHQLADIKSKMGLNAGR